MSTSFFVAADWLAEHIDDPKFRLSTPRMAPAGRRPPVKAVAEYRAGHVPNALFFDIEAPSDHTSPVAAWRCRGRGCRRHARIRASAAISIWWSMTKASTCFPPCARGGCCALW